ncbi:YaiI/YqxD family protein [Thalassobacillus pellis]|uniref:YaiI/YqxD family protein n=1 Tax=Thalassobacillus pellis TaxID=748008 RepID=UPI00195F8B6D|nr:DUF188 domain-containing protein [Thalassobacillus pellis]MBM7554739.1 uncharacterized protein YaiI (UPF0178 family) [Thalassobacillus pellis]
MLEYRVNIFVDADSCPVKEEIDRVCSSHCITPIYVATINHYSPVQSQENWKIIDDDDQAVDLYILNRVKKGDLVITQDLAFAVLLTARGVYAMTPRGKLISEDDADEILLRRHLRQKNQRSGKRIKGPSPFHEQDRLKFQVRLDEFLSKDEGIY